MVYCCNRRERDNKIADVHNIEVHSDHCILDFSHMTITFKHWVILFVIVHSFYTYYGMLLLLLGYVVVFLFKP
jgi:hypothetical protein